MSEGDFVVVKRGKKGPVAPTPVPSKPPSKAPVAAKPKKTKPPPPGWATAPAKQQAVKKAVVCDQSPARLGQLAVVKSTAAAERLPPWKKREEPAAACQRSAASTGCPSGPPSDTASARSTSPHGGVDDRPQATSQSEALGQAAAALLKRAQESQQEALRKKEAEQAASAAKEHHGAALAQAMEQDPRKVAEPVPPAAGPMQARATFAADYAAPAGGYLTAARGELVSVSYADGDWFYGQVADRAGWFARDAVILS